MGMALSRIEFVNFRNHAHLQLDGLGPLTIFVGPNAVGKTNIIEGIQLLTAQTSFRHPTIPQLIQHGASFARLEAWAGDGVRELQSTLQIVEGKKRRFLNGKPKRAAEMRGVLPAVAFCPDDLELTRSASSIKRESLDSLGAQLSANHHQIKNDYEKTLRGKNRLLHDEASDALIESINEVMILTGAQLTCYRSALFFRLANEMSRFYSDIAGGGEVLEASYTPSWEEHDPQRIVREEISRDEARQKMAAALAVRKVEEKVRHRSVVGPHADHLDFFIDGKNVSAYASQGQKRSLVLAFKLAETALIEEILGQKPILLLDDVMGELDAARRAALMQNMAGGMQTFITTANLGYFDEDMVERANIVRLPLEENENLKRRKRDGRGRTRRTEKLKMLPDKENPKKEADRPL